MKLWLAFLFLVFGVLGATFLLVDFAARDRAINEADRALEMRAQFLADQLDRVLQLRMVELFTFAALPSMRGFAASDETTRAARTAVALSELQAIAAADPNVRAAFILDPTGTVILATNAGLMNSAWGERAFVRDALAGKITASAPAREFGELSQYYAAPILNNAGDVAGVFVLRVVVQEMWSALGMQNDVMLVDENGVRLADRSTQPQIFVALAPLTTTVSTQLIAEKRYGADLTQIAATTLADVSTTIKRSESARVVYRDAQNQMVRAATRRLKTNVWTVIVFTPEANVLAPVRDAIIDQLIIAFMVALVCGGSFAVAWLTLRPTESRA